MSLTSAALVVLSALSLVATEREMPSLKPFAQAGLTDSRPRRFALVVGIDAFEDDRFVDLHHAVQDARSFGTALSEFDDVQVLDSPERTSRAAVLEALETLASKARHSKDTVVLYFSSHGSLAYQPGQDLERFLVVSDSRLNLMSQTGISLASILEKVDALPSRSKAVFFATCHSGQGKSKFSDAVTRALKGRKAPLRALEAVSEATMIFSAAAFGESAKEDDELKHDVYTYFLLESFSQGDRDHDGVVTASEAHDYARSRTYAYTQGAQRPTAEISMLGDDPVALVGKRSGPRQPIIYSYAPSSEGLSLEVDGQAKGVLPGGFAVSPGEHKVRLVDTQSGASLFEEVVQIGNAQRLEVSALIPPEPRVRLWAGPSTFLALGAQTRHEFLPPTFGITLGATAEHLAFRNGYLGAKIDLRAGSGDATGFDERVPFSVLAYGGRILFGYGWHPTKYAALNAGAEFGVHKFERRFDTTSFHATQSTTAFTSGVETSMMWALSPTIEVGLQASSGALMVDFGGNHEPRLYLELGVRVLVLNTQPE
ncbi:MAG: caspase family protein [Deltaproteobacteria bacterium]|nr:caspase family protein [Deltaproteobacteria bacterium]